MPQQMMVPDPRNMPGMNPLMIPRQAQNVRREYFPIYDTVRLPGGAAVPSGDALLWYQVPLSQIGSGFVTPKTLAETNLTNAGRLPAEVEHHVLYIQISIRPEAGEAQDPTAQTSMQQVLDNMALSFTQPGFRRDYGPLDMYPQGGGLAAGFAGQATGYNVTNGAPAMGASVRLLEPIILGRGQSFNFVAHVARTFTPAVGIRLRMQATGVQYRDVVQG